MHTWPNRSQVITSKIFILHDFYPKYFNAVQNCTFRSATLTVVFFFSSLHCLDLFHIVFASGSELGLLARASHYSIGCNFTGLELSTMGFRPTPFEEFTYFSPQSTNVRLYYIYSKNSLTVKFDAFAVRIEAFHDIPILKNTRRCSSEQFFVSSSSKYFHGRSAIYYGYRGFSQSMWPRFQTFHMLLVH